MNNEQATLVGNAMAAAHAAAYRGLDSRAAYNKVLNTPEAQRIIDKTVNDLKDYYSSNRPPSERAKGMTFAQAAEAARADVRTFRNEVNDLTNPVSGTARITNSRGVPINTVVDPRTGQRVQDPTKSRAFTEAGRQAVLAAEAAQKQAEIAEKAFRDKVEREKEQDRAADQAAADAQAAQSQRELGGYERGDGGSGGNDDRDIGKDEASAGGAGGGYGLSHAKGGLIKK